MISYIFSLSELALPVLWVLLIYVFVFFFPIIFYFPDSWHVSSI